MSDTIDDYKSMADHKKRMREQYGINCPVCTLKLPKAHPTIMLPKQRCKVCGYVDQRPHLTNEQYAAI
jgi:uncharacterized Zn finger protein